MSCSCYGATIVDEISQMAGSRLEKFGTIFTRVRDLMRSGVIKPHEKPLWYDVYEAFPPKRDPLYVKPQTRRPTKKRAAVPDIFYSEDEIRAIFFVQCEARLPFELYKRSSESTCQRFVDQYTELKSCSELDASALFDATMKALLTKGVHLRMKQPSIKVSESRDPVLELKLKDMLEEQQSVGDEQQSVGDDSAETTHTEHTP